MRQGQILTGPPVVWQRKSLVYSLKDTSRPRGSFFLYQSPTVCPLTWLRHRQSKLKQCLGYRYFVLGGYSSRVGTDGSCGTCLY